MTGPRLVLTSLFCSFSAFGQTPDPARFKPDIAGIGIGRTVTGKLLEILSVVDFGADPSGVSDSLPSFNSAKAVAGVSGVIRVPHGTFRLSGQFVLNASELTLLCDPGARIVYKGTTDIDSLIYATGSTHVNVDSCLIAGNSHLKSYVHGTGLSHSAFRNLTTFSVDGISWAGNCLTLDNGNTNHVDSLLCSGAFNAGAAHPASVGINLIDEVNDIVTMPQVEQITNEGIKLTHATGVACAGNHFRGGTSEGNGTGISVGFGCNGNRFEGMDMEANRTVDIVDAGMDNQYVSSGADKVRFTASAVMGLYSLAATNSIDIDPGAVGIRIIGNTWDNSGGRINDHGERTTLFENRDANGGAYLPNRIMGISSNPSDNSLGFNTSAALPSDDPKGYLPAFRAYSDWYTMGTGPGTFPSCDATHGHGVFWYDKGAPGVTGRYQACIKDNTDKWAWRVLYEDAGRLHPTASAQDCTPVPKMGVACASAGCTRKVAVVTAVSMSCHAGR